MNQTRPRKDYGRRHSEARARMKPIVLAGGVKCSRCGEPIQPDEEWDLDHRDGEAGYRGPSHMRCNRSAKPWHQEQWQPLAEPVREPAGIDARDARWDVPWLRGLRRVPANAVWPRFMTVPHSSAVGSYGPRFERYALERSGRPLRWWQRLVARRLLEHDADGVLVWEAAILTLARQLGKSWLLREFALWRMHQGDRLGEPQLILNTGSNLAVVREVQRPARVWAKGRRHEYQVREVNGQEEVEYLHDSSRWMLRAKEAVYGYGASLALVDEGWKVSAASVEEGLVPTMVERVEPQLWLVSTAHRKATSLMLDRRRAALEHLEDSEGDLLLEWSSPREAPIDDRRAWRQASPHWTSQRERLIERRCEAARLGEAEVDPEEPDPIESFRSQWMNVWPLRKAEPQGDVVDLLPAGMWAGLTVSDLWTDGPVYVALEDDFGKGAAVAVTCLLDDGRIEVDGWLRDDWDQAFEDVLRLADWREIRELHVGASLLDRVPADEGLPKPKPAAAAQTRLGLALVRDLVAGAAVVHDDTTRELDVAMSVAKVKENATGLYLVAVGSTHLVRAAAWALQAAHKPARVPAIF